MIVIIYIAIDFPTGSCTCSEDHTGALMLTFVENQISDMELFVYFLVLKNRMYL